MQVQGPTVKTISAGDLCRFRSKRRSCSCLQEEGDKGAISPRITWSTGNFCTAPYARPSSQPTASLVNKTWDEDKVVASFSVPNSAASYKYKHVKHVQSTSGHISDDSDSGSDHSLSLPRPGKAGLKSSLVSDTTPRSKVAKHVHFTFTEDNELSYEVTKDDIKNSWLDIDVSGAIEATENEMIVSFGPTGHYSTASDNTGACKNGKGYMVRIQERRLINEMMGQRTNLRQSVLQEQARQKREGIVIVDAEEMNAVASKQSKWGVELAKSSWWLRRT
jgi:hypothetical protein